MTKASKLAQERYRNKHRNRLQVKYRDRYHADKQFRENRHKIFASWRVKNRLKHMLSIIRCRSKRLGREFDITIDDLTIPDVCPYLGIKIDMSLGNGRLPGGPSIDRIDNDKGYIKGNVQIISSKANTMKADASKEQLITFAKNVLKIHG